MSLEKLKVHSPLAFALGKAEGSAGARNAYKEALRSLRGRFLRAARRDRAEARRVPYTGAFLRGSAMAERYAASAVALELRYL